MMEDEQFKDEAEFTQWLETQKYPEHFRRARLLRSKTEDALVKGGLAPSGSAYAKAVALIFGKAYKSYVSALCLAGRGLTEDMGVVVRSLLNLFIIAKWIATADREARATRYLEWYWVEMYKLMDLIPAPQSAKTDIEQEYRRVKPFFEHMDKKGNMRMPVTWHGSNIRQMATEVGLVQHYQIVYAPLSAYEHSSSLAYFGMLSDADRDGGTLIRLRDHQFVPFYLGYGYQYLAGILWIWNDQYSAFNPRVLDTELMEGVQFFSPKPTLP
jgi:hypothetical protein